MSSHHPSRSDPTHLQSGLTKALDKLGRTRGSSATPTPTLKATNNISTTPQRVNLEERIVRMKQFAGNESSTGSGRSSESALHQVPRYSSARRQSPESSNRTSDIQRCMNYGSNQQYYNRGSSASSNLMAEFSAYIQNQLIELKKSIKDTPGITYQAQEQLDAAINNIGQEFNFRQQPLQAAFDDAWENQLRYKTQLSDMNAQVLAANLDRDLAYTQVTESKLKKQQSFDRQNKAIQDLEESKENLVKKLEAHEDQFSGKRVPWVEKNSSERHNTTNTQTQDPFNSPSGMKGRGKKGVASMVGCSMGSIGSAKPGLTGSMAPSVTGNMVNTGGMTGGLEKLNVVLGSTSVGTNFKNLSLGPSPLISQSAFDSPPVTSTPIGGRLRRRGQLPTGNPGQSILTPSMPATKESFLHSLASLPANTEPGSSDMILSQALIVHGNGVGIYDPAPKYEALFTELYNASEIWCTNYVSIPNLPVDEAIPTTNPALRNYMVECTYPGHHRSDANAQVLALLQDPKSRYLFAMRMATTYCVKNIMTLEEFEHFSPTTEATLVQCKKALFVRGLANEVRQTIINRQTHALQEVTQHASFAEFRSSRLLHHTKQLRDMLGPILNSHISRADAGKELGLLAAKAFDVCIALYTSFLTFQICFPETASKYNAATMVARDMLSRDPLLLQNSQTRLKLVITPIVTMRDDRGPTIRVKNLHKAQVLTAS